MRRVLVKHVIVFFISFVLLGGIAQASEVCTPPRRFNTPEKTNFKTCHDKIKNMTIDERRDSRCFDGDLERAILTLGGCKVMCGDGIDFWEWKDIFNRLSLLVLPTIVLIADLGFPPLGWLTYLICPVQAIGNPIGRFQSLLIRFTIHRAYRRLAQSENIFFPRPEQSTLPRRQISLSRSLATVYSAYEEFGWQDISAISNWPMTLNEKEQRIITTASYELSSTRLTSRVPAIIAIVTLVGTLITAIVRTVKQIDPSNVRIQNETAHTIAVVCVLFVTIPQVWFGARLGTFTTDAGAIHILETMRYELDCLETRDGQTRPLFPPLQLAVCPGHGVRTWISKWVPTRVVIFFSRCPLEQLEPKIESLFLPQEPEWRGSDGNFMGINSSWRGCNRMALDSCAPGHFQLFVISVLFAVCGAGLPAFFLSASNNSVKTKIGIGCRSLSWIGIMTSWILSFAFDSIFRGYVCQSTALQAPVDKLRKLWRLSIAKDAFVTSVVITLVLLVQVGTYNSCSCRSSFRGIVNLMGYTLPEWERARRLWCTLPLGGLAINLSLILWVEFARWDVGGRCEWAPRFAIQSGTLLCKNEEEMEAEWVTINELRNSARETIENDDTGGGNANNEEGVELRLLHTGSSFSDDEQLRLLEERPALAGNSSVANPFP